MFRYVMSGLLTFAFLFAPIAYGQARAVSDEFTSILRQGARNAGRSANDIPVERFRTFANQVDSDVISNSVRGIRQIDDATVAALRRSDPDFFRRIDALPDGERVIAIRVADGAAQLRNASGSIAARGRIIREAGPDGMLLISRHGDDSIIALRRIESATNGGQLPPSALADFSRNMNRAHPNAFSEVWNKAIMPNWGKFLAGGTVAAFIVAPEEFLDAAGNLTQRGTEAFGEFVPELMIGGIAATIQGVLRGIWNVATGPYAAGFWVAFIAIISWLGFRVYRLIGGMRSSKAS